MRDGQKMLDQVVSLGAEPGAKLGAIDVARLLGAFTDEQTERLLAGIAGGGVLQTAGLTTLNGGTLGTSRSWTNIGTVDHVAGTLQIQDAAIVTEVAGGGSFIVVPIDKVTNLRVFLPFLIRSYLSFLT